MRIPAAAASALCLLVSACGEPDSGVPIRPTAVPPTAVWAGGPDGGAWLDCVALERMANRYRCAAYDDHAGALWAEGEYVLVRSHWDEARKRASFEPVDSRPPLLHYDAFDGETIYLADSLCLVPDGWIVYRGETGDEKRFFAMGAHRGEEAGRDRGGE